LLTAAPVSLERLHLCCKGSSEFVESSLRTVLWRNPHRRSIFDPGKIETDRPADFLILQEQKTDPPPVLKIFKLEMRISAGVGKINDQVTVISMTHLPRFTPLFMALPEGGPAACSNVDAMQSADV
jgi:hypothetical protein